MPQFGGKPKKTSSDSKRHFTVVMKGKEHGLYVSSTPSSAARKAVTKLCAANKSKKVEFYIREITQGSKKKTYGLYEGYIEKLKEPIELKGRIIRYKPVVKLNKKKGVQKGGFIDYFAFVFTGSYKELENISDAEINKLLKDIDAKIEISRKTKLINTKIFVKPVDKLVEIIVKITPNTFSNNSRYFDEVVSELKYRVIDIFTIIFKQTRSSQQIQIYLRTFFVESTNQNDEIKYKDEEITPSIKEKIKEKIEKFKLIRISFFVFENNKIINLIKEKIIRILREQIFFGPYEIKIEELTLSFEGHTALSTKQINKKIDDIEVLLYNIPNINEIILEFKKRTVFNIKTTGLKFGNINKKFSEIRAIFDFYGAPFTPRISEFWKNEKKFGNLRNNNNSSSNSAAVFQLPSAPPLEYINE
jgi:hypothetical protein